MKQPGIDSLPRAVSDGGRHQHLPGVGETRNTSGEIDREALDARMRAITIDSRSLAHLAQVQPDAYAGQIGRFVVRLLKQQGKRHGSAWGVEGQEAAVAGPIDDAAVAVHGKATNGGAMPVDQIADRSISALALQCGGIRKVCERERERPRMRGCDHHGACKFDRNAAGSAEVHSRSIRLSSREPGILGQPVRA